MASNLVDAVGKRFGRALARFDGNASGVPYGIVHFALLMALEDLDECWQDEVASVQRRLELAGETLMEQVQELERRQAVIDGLQAGLQQVMIENDALEAECNRLKTMVIGASSVPIFVQMEPPAADVSSTSKPADPMRPSPAVSSTGNDDDGERVLSARTLRRRREQAALRQAQRPGEVGEIAGGRPFDWAAELGGVLTPGQIGRLEAGKMKWHEMEKTTQRQVVLRIAEAIHARLGDISQSLYRDYKPAWATSHSSWIKTCDLTWAEVLDLLGVTPSMLPKSRRIGRSGSGG